MVISIGSAYGIIVAVFQWGWGSSLLGIEGAPADRNIAMKWYEQAAEAGDRMALPLLQALALEEN